MKKLLFLCLAAISFSLHAQTNPNVTITVGTITPTTVEATFTRNSDCTNYGIVLAEPNEMATWCMMFGCGLPELVDQFALQLDRDTTYTWREMVPATDYNIYVLAKSADTAILYTVAVSTTTQGSADPSVITIAVSNITTTSALVTCTPNAATALFKDMIVTDEFYQAVGADSIRNLLLETPYVFYEEDVWDWQSLGPDTTYRVVAMGQNANEVWGEMATYTFKTLALNGIFGKDKSVFLIYPNPTSGRINIDGAEIEKVEILNLNGAKVLESNSKQMNIESLSAGQYLLRIFTQNGTSTHKIIKK